MLFDAHLFIIHIVAACAHPRAPPEMSAICVTQIMSER